MTEPISVASIKREYSDAKRKYAEPLHELREALAAAGVLSGPSGPRPDPKPTPRPPTPA